MAAEERAAAAGEDEDTRAARARATADALEPGQRDLFWFLCCLDEADRDRDIIEDTWENLWELLDRDEGPPETGPALAAIVACGLAAVAPQPEQEPDAPAPDDDEAAIVYLVDPVVAAAGRRQAGEDFAWTADSEAASYWASVHHYATGAEGDPRFADAGLVVQAALSAVPYQLRHQQWDDAAVLLASAISWDPSPATAAAVLAPAELVAGHEPRHEAILARALAAADPGGTGARLHDYMTTAAARGNYRSAALAAGELVTLRRDAGQLAEALDLARQRAEYTRAGGYGPWSRLADEAGRLQVLGEMGRSRLVLDEVTRLRAGLAAHPAAGPPEIVAPWQAREALLAVGRRAATVLARPADALALNAELVASKEGRAASAAEVATARFSDYQPLLRLGRAEDALAVLLSCQKAFADAKDNAMMGKVLSALADVEDEGGHGASAVRLERDALRNKLKAADASSIAASYHNLGYYLRVHDRRPALALASHLAAALLRVLHASGGAPAGGAADSLGQAAIDLRELGPAARREPVLPASVAELCCALADVSDTVEPDRTLTRLIERLCPDAGAAEQALSGLIALAAEMAGPGERPGP
ncbi:MAG TPA: hypothetical protein VH478_13750 [Trebonia sp.]|nr:hypothetical protein [Trebonia sp.]